MRELKLIERVEKEGVEWKLMRGDVVPCEDCKYWVMDYELDNGWRLCNRTGNGEYTGSDDFCSRGEKR